MKPLLSLKFLLLLLVSSCSHAQKHSPPKETPDAAKQQLTKKPNILFIAIDDLNDWVGFLGERKDVITPNLDKLAQKSVAFSNAHCAAPSCHPSRIAVMTGIRPSTSRVTHNVRPFAKLALRENKVLKTSTTLSQYFRNHGYRAVGGGKIYHVLQWYDGNQNDPNTWDGYFPSFEKNIPKWVRPKLIPDKETGLTTGRPLGGGRQFFGAKALQVPDKETSDHQVVDWAISELQKKHEKPFFVAAGIFRPHIPWEVPQKYFDLYPLEKIQLPKVLDDDLSDAKDHLRHQNHRWLTRNNLWKEFVQGYLASVSYVDHQIGRLINALEKSPYADNTIIVLWSDHGFHLGEKKNWEKFTLWEESTRVPLIIHAPSAAEVGKICNDPVSLIDIYPTLCELTGLKIPKQCEGESLVSQLNNVNARGKQPAIITYRYLTNSGSAVRTKNWRYIKYADGFEELYDHKNDPDEFHNLAKDKNYSQIIQELSKWMPDYKY